MRTRLPVILAGLALIVGWSALAFTVFGPTYGTATTTIDGNGVVSSSTGTTSLFANGLSPVTVFFLGLFALCYLAVFTGALANSRDRGSGRALMAVGLFPLLALGTLSMGLVLAMPATLLALAATVAAFASARRTG